MSYWVKASFNTLDSIPTIAGVYAIYDSAAELIYIGYSADIRANLLLHRRLEKVPGCFVKYRPSFTVAGWASAGIKLTAKLRPRCRKGSYTWEQLRAMVRAVPRHKQAVFSSDRMYKYKVLYPSTLYTLLQLKERGLTYPLIALSLNRLNLLDRYGRRWVGSSVKKVYKALPASVDIL